ncbi:MAG: hypothetical protein RLZZ624_1003 [Cyanobacteriota bacterium]
MTTPVRPCGWWSAALRQRLIAPALALGLLSACDGSNLLGQRLSGDWCLPTGSSTGGEALILRLSGNGTGLLSLIPGTEPSLPLDWREDRDRLLLMQPGSQQIAYTVPIVADAQGQPQLMLPGLGSLLNLNLRRCAGTAATPGTPGTPSGTADPAPLSVDSSSAVTLAVVLGAGVGLLLVGAIAVVAIQRGRDDD